MADNHDPVSYKWEIHYGNQYALYHGSDRATSLGSLFAMWLQDRGDVSDWQDGPLFGALVHTHSDLSLPVIAVWLGVELPAIYDADVPTSDPPWEFDGPDGEPMTLDCTVTSKTKRSRDEPLRRI